jgi:hypothetical protein
MLRGAWLCSLLGPRRLFVSSVIWYVYRPNMGPLRFHGFRSLSLESNVWLRKSLLKTASVLVGYATTWPPLFGAFHFFLIIRPWMGHGPIIYITTHPDSPLRMIARSWIAVVCTYLVGGAKYTMTLYSDYRNRLACITFWLQWINTIVAMCSQKIRQDYDRPFTHHRAEADICDNKKSNLA